MTSPKNLTKSAITSQSVYVRNWHCKKHNTFGDNPFLPCAICGYSGRGRMRIFESFDDYRKYLGDKV